MRYILFIVAVAASTIVVLYSAGTVIVFNAGERAEVYAANSEKRTSLFGVAGLLHLGWPRLEGSVYVQCSSPFRSDELGYITHLGIYVHSIEAPCRASKKAG